MSRIIIKALGTGVYAYTIRPVVRDDITGAKIPHKRNVRAHNPYACSVREVRDGALKFVVVQILFDTPCAFMCRFHKSQNK